MSRTARIVVPEYVYHVTQRGNNRRRVFYTTADRKRYLSWIAKYSKEFHLTILGYCLMDNHVHFVVIPHQQTSLAKTFSLAHMQYAQYFNQKNASSGHLWQGRFYSCMVDEMRLPVVLKYVECNPCRAGIVKKPWQWRWSSAGSHAGFGQADLPLGEALQYMDEDSADWRGYLQQKEYQGQEELIRQATRLNRVFGRKEFIQVIEKKVNRQLVFSRKGRPRKK